MRCVNSLTVHHCSRFDFARIDDGLMQKRRSAKHKKTSIECVKEYIVDSIHSIVYKKNTKRKWNVAWKLEAFMWTKKHNFGRYRNLPFEKSNLKQLKVNFRYFEIGVLVWPKVNEKFINSLCSVFNLYFSMESHEINTMI